MTGLEALRAQLQGQAFVPGDAGYDTARQTWNATTFDQHPAIVVMPAAATDVVAAVGFARDRELAIAVQGGGHGHPYPADDAMLVNFANMRGVQIDAGSATARVEPGARWVDVIQAAHPHGLAPLNGFASTVGVVGYILGGGIGWLTRQYGGAAGSIRSLDLVTAEGAELTVNEHTHPELLWGLRGGGGNFGVVTALECGLYPVKEIFAGKVIYPIALAREVLSAYRQWANDVPDELTSALRIMHFPPVPDVPPVLRGVSAVVVMACYNGDSSTGAGLLAPLRSLGTPLLDTFASIPYTQVGTIANDPTDAPPVLTYMDGGGLREVSPGGIESLVGRAGDPASGIFIAEIRHLGGALARQPEEAMPFGLRRAGWYLTVLAAAPTPDLLERAKRSITELLRALQPDLTGEILINALDAGNVGSALTRAAYSASAYGRLAALKHKYDPHNVFRFNHNIAPSPSGG